MIRIVVAMTLVLFGPIAPRIAYADSDGYYCVGPHYLAYQFGFGAPPAGSHRLSVLRFDPSSRVEAPIVFELPQFQVHGMRCDEQVIELAAWDAFYTVHLDSAHRPLGYDTTSRDPAQPIPARFRPAENLGAWNRTAKDFRAQRLPLATLSDGGKLHLEISGRPIASEPCRAMVTTHVVRTDRNGREIEHRQIFRGLASRECGE